MSQPKPAASLSSGLLARKGHARPAMRPQGFGGFGTVACAIDDLGWNDMGQGDEALPVAEVTPLPPVLREREVLKEEIEVAAPRVSAPAVVAQIAPAPRPARGRAPGKAKAAFTLRLDDSRHLRLRLASAVCNRSAQRLVTEALDAFLQTLPEVEELVAALPEAKD